LTFKNAPLPDGGYSIWGQFEVIMSQGVAGGVHIWEAQLSL